MLIIRAVTRKWLPFVYCAMQLMLAMAIPIIDDIRFIYAKIHIIRLSTKIYPYFLLDYSELITTFVM